jgi:predicted TIM-barrel fold metal-dependent hydrolase
MTTDVHQHLWPEALVRVLRARRVAPYLRRDELVTPEGAFPVDLALHDPEHRVSLLDRDGIDVAVLSLQPSLGAEALPADERDELELAWMEGAAAVVEAGGGRFRAWAPWRLADGFAGASVGASAFLELDRHDGLLRAADDAGAVVFVHPESESVTPPGLPEWWGWTVGYTAQMQRSYYAWLGAGRARFPRLRVVFAMLAGGAIVQHERLVHRGVDVRAALDPATLFDTASYGRRALELCIETFGVERLVYGSDTPVVDPRPTLAAVRGLGDSVAHIVQTETPARLFT